MPHDFDERLIIDENKRRHIIYDEHIIRYEFIVPLVKEKEVLDIACGSGYGAKILADAGAKKVTGMDIDKEAIAYAKAHFSHPSLEFKEASATQTGIPDRSMDIISSFETIEHIPDYETYLKELCRIIKEDGLVFISTPNREVYKEKNPFHVKEFSREEFTGLLKKYFNTVRIIDQKNGIATWLSEGKNSQTGKISTTGAGDPQYFLAICSKDDLAENIPLTPVASLNPLALEDLYNNPGMKIVNAIYTTLIKIPGVKKIFEKIR